MTVEDFLTKIIILNEEESTASRMQYIEAFIDKQTEYFVYDIQPNMVIRKRYDTFLWDCISARAIDMNAKSAYKIISSKNEVLVMWDAHHKYTSGESVASQLFPLYTVLKMKSYTLIQNLDKLPDDVYVFDHTFT